MNLEELAKKVDANARRLDENARKINQNIKRIQQNSYALDILRDYKKESKKWFIAFIIASVLLIIMAIHHFIIM